MRQNRRVQRDMRRRLYNLERRIGIAAELHLNTVGALDLDTGEQERVVTSHLLPRFIVIDVNVASKFQYSLSYLAANSNFGYGGIFEVGDRFGLVSYQQLPRNYAPNKTDTIHVDGVRYVIHRYEILTANTGIIFHLRTTKGSTSD